MPDGSAPGIDPAFLALPMRRLADAALGRARELGAQHADFRLERIRAETLRLHDARLEGARDADDLGYAVRVVKNGTWGFAAGIDLTPDAAARVAEQAIEVATVAATVNREPIELAPEPVYPDATWVSSYEIDPFTVPLADKIALLADWSAGLLAPCAIEYAVRPWQCDFTGNLDRHRSQRVVRKQPTTPTSRTSAGATRQTTAQC